MAIVNAKRPSARASQSYTAGGPEIREVWLTQGRSDR
jgi:hypothetical protein